MPGRWLRLLRPWHRDALDADNAFSAGPPEHAALLREASAALGLATAAIDYSCRADETPILWEANPYFHLVERRYYHLAGPRGFDARRRAFLRTLAALLRDVLDETTTDPGVV